MDVFDMVVVLAALSVVTKMWRAFLDYRIKAAGMRAGQPDKAALASSRELEDLRQAVDALRETTTGFDVAFDTALQRLESRLTYLEARMARVEASGQQPEHLMAGRIGE